MMRIAETVAVLAGRAGTAPAGGQRDALITSLRIACAEAETERDRIERKLMSQWAWLWTTPEDDPRYGEREAIWLAVLRDYEVLCDAIALGRETIARPAWEVVMPCPF